MNPRGASGPTLGAVATHQKNPMHWPSQMATAQSQNRRGATNPATKPPMSNVPE
jgi:hypothetical protein